MRWRLLLVAGLLAGCTGDDAPDDDLTAVHPPEIARATSARQALTGANLPMLDPATLNDAEIARSLAEGPRCDFRYTIAGAPVLAVRMEPTGVARAAVVKLNGHLVPLEPAPAEAGAEAGARLRIVADPIRLYVEAASLAPRAGDRDSRRQEANMIFEVGDRLRAGYRGFLDCALEPRTQALGHR